MRADEPPVHSWHIPGRENGTGLNLTVALNLETAVVADEVAVAVAANKRIVVSQRV